jgi:hypothetical protein
MVTQASITAPVFSQDWSSAAKNVSGLVLVRSAAIKFCVLLMWLVLPPVSFLVLSRKRLYIDIKEGETFPARPELAFMQGSPLYPRSNL